MAQPQLGYSREDGDEEKPRREDDPELLRRKIARLEGDLVDAKAALEDERKRSASTLRSQARLKNALQPVYTALQMVFGELGDVENDTGAPSQSGGASQPPNAAAYSAWKQQLPPACGKIIDALLVQPLTSSQISTMCKMHYDTATKSLGILSRNGLTEKDGNRYKLRRL